MGEQPGVDVNVAMSHFLFTAAFLGFVWGLYKGYRRWLDSRYQHRLRCERDAAQLSAVFKELHPNGGASLADRVSRIESVTNENRDTLASMEHVHRDIQARVDGLYELLIGPGANVKRRVAVLHHRNREEDPDEAQ